MRSVLTIGTFDGVHLGHRALLARARAAAAEAAAHGVDGRPAVVALAFDPHPLEALRPEAAPPRLTTWEQRRELLLGAGADRVERLEPTPELLGLMAEEFLDRLEREHRPLAFVEGADFRFGRGRAGDVGLLRRIGAERGFRVDVVAPVGAALSDHSVVTVSSTLVRWLLANGRVRDAAALLGRPHTLRGTVTRGDRRGRELGFPTANLRAPCMLPADGVYAGRARLPDGRSYVAAVHVGERPTFAGASPTLEAHLLGVPTEEDAAAAPGSGPARRIAGLPEYGWSMDLELHGWVRDQVKFDSVAELVGQIERDCRRIAEVMAADGAGAHPPRIVPQEIEI